MESPIKACAPFSSYDDFPVDVKDFKNLRMPMFLVETSDSKAPPESDFGEKDDACVVEFLKYGDRD